MSSLYRVLKRLVMFYSFKLNCNDKIIVKLYDYRANIIINMSVRKIIKQKLNI